MALFEEKEVSLSGGNLEKISLQKLNKCDSIVFYFVTTSTRTSKEYGDFQVCEGLKLDVNTPGVDAMVESAVGASFVPNTFLQNAMQNGNLETGRVYRIEKAWDRGDKFDDGKNAKGYGYKIFELNVDGPTRSKLNERFTTIQAGATEEEL